MRLLPRLLGAGLLAFLTHASPGSARSPLVSLRLAWQTPLASAGAPGSIPAVDGGRLFLVSSGVEAYSLETGKALWQSPLRSYAPRSLVAARGLVFVAEATVSALDAGSGRRRWEFTPDANASLGRAATDGHALYVGTASHRLYALRAGDGRQLWATDLGPNWTYPAVVRGVTVRQDKVYATVEQWRDPKGRTSTGWLFALEAGNGRVIWRYGTGEGNQRAGLSSSPLVTSHLVVAADFLSNAIVAVDRSSGREAWRFHGEPGFAGFPEAPVLAGKVVYAGSGDSYVYAVDAATGHLRWRQKRPSSIDGYALCGRGLLVNDQELAMFDPPTGRVVQTALDHEDGSPASLLAAAGDAYVVGAKAIYSFHCSE
jgi:outer membrane protein assembly factor BamB